MIKVNVLVNKNIEKVILTGHACYDDFGKDIVCSAAFNSYNNNKCDNKI